MITMIHSLGRQNNQPILGVKRELWRMDDEHASESDKEFEAIRADILMRDNFTCKFCSFRCSKYQEVHHWDNNHANSTRENLLTTCNLCHQIFHLGMASIRDAGYLAYIPELSHTEINCLVRSMMVMPHVAGADPAHLDMLQSLNAIFQSRGPNYIKDVTKSDIGDISRLAEWLSNCPQQEFDARETLLSGIRLIPKPGAFAEKQLQFYAIQLTRSFKSTELVEQALAFLSQAA